MEKALRTSDEGVVVYICPTKALANQVYAEIEARFEKQYRDGRPFCGIFTRDKRSERLMDCQVIVMVPQCLMIYLLSPTAEMHAWVRRLEYAILDEVHCLGGENGEVWEQLLSLIPCPVIALSATLGSSEGFTAWLRKLQAQQGRELHVIKQVGRFNDLQSWVFEGKLHPLHPFLALRGAVHASASEQVRPKNLHLIPEAGLQLYDSLASKCDLRSLAPEAFFASLPQGTWNLSMSQVQKWSQSVAQEFDRAERAVQVAVVDALTKEARTAFERVEDDLEKERRRYLKKHFGALVEELRSADLLPAITFHDSRLGCEHLAHALVRSLIRREVEHRKADNI